VLAALLGAALAVIALTTLKAFLVDTDALVGCGASCPSQASASR